MTAIPTPNSRLMANLSYRRAIERLHSLGPRAVGELVSDLAEAEDCNTAVLDLLYRYGRLTPQMVQKAGGDAMPPNPVHSVVRRVG